jgi:hypothetical protein
MSSRVSEQDRRIYAEIANCLLPACGEFESAQAAGVAGAVLDDILGWRPDIAPDLLRGLVKSRDVPAQEAVVRLASEDPESYAAIRLAVFGAYYLNGGVRAVLGYRGQENRPVAEDEIPDYLADNLLGPVKAMPRRWRNPEP